MRANRFEISVFSCPACGSTMPIPRQKSWRREKHHVKDLYCFSCKKTVKMIERRPKDFDYMTRSDASLANAE